MFCIPNKMNLKKSKRTIKEIIVHCTATPEGLDKTVEQIRNEHLAQGWNDIGYHYLIDSFMITPRQST